MTVYSIGNPLIDILCYVDDSDLEALGLSKGIMLLVDEEKRTEILEAIRERKKTVSCGGSAPNTMVTLRMLGVETTLAGGIGDDEYGGIYRSRLRESGVHDETEVFQAATGTSIILLTPDGERTMNTYLGANRLFDADRIREESVRNAGLFYFTGYMWDTPQQKSAVRKALEIAKECRPKMIVAGASAYARTIDFKRFREIADEVGAYLMVDMAHIAGLVAAGLHPSPIPYAHVTTTTTHKTLRGPRGGMILSSNEMNEKFNFNKAVFPGIQGGPLMHVIAAKAVCFKEALQPEFKEYQKQILRNAKALCEGLKKRGVKIVSGDTDNHLMLVDLTEAGVSGKELEKRLDDAHVTCNKNTIPNDPRSPFVTSGVRLGTPAVTTRGMKEEDMDKIAEILAMVIESEDNVEAARKMAAELTEKYPLC